MIVLVILLVILLDILCRFHWQSKAYSSNGRHANVDLMRSYRDSTWVHLLSLCMSCIRIRVQREKIASLFFVSFIEKTRGQFNGRVISASCSRIGSMAAIFWNTIRAEAHRGRQTQSVLLKSCMPSEVWQPYSTSYSRDIYVPYDAPMAMSSATFRAWYAAR